jgi:hypothetical protein
VPAFSEISTLQLQYPNYSLTSSDSGDELQPVAKREKSTSRDEFMALAGRSAEMLLGRSALLQSSELFALDQDMTSDFRGLEGLKHDGDDLCFDFCI